MRVFSLVTRSTKPTTCGFMYRLHLISKLTTMTNNEILHANLLDIVFDNRNKDYGAYDLRKGYNNRLLIALGAGLSVILFFVLLNSANKRKEQAAPVTSAKEAIVIRTIQLPKEDIKLPEPQKQLARQKPVAKIATVNYTTPPVIKKDVEVKNEMVAVKELKGKEISDKTTEGKESDNAVIINKESVENPGSGTINSTGPSQPEFVIEERDPEFPGGQKALNEFLTRNLRTPQDLQEGEKKIVQIKFKVEKDGSVTGFDIVTSGGNEFDSEVVRVVKKMPRWTPAVQNGINVPVSYVLPVTFIGIE